MVGWHHGLNGHGFGWTPGVGDGQESLVCGSPWGCEELGTAEQLKTTSWAQLPTLGHPNVKTPFSLDSAVAYCFLQIFFISW